MYTRIKVCSVEVVHQSFLSLYCLSVYGRFVGILKILMYIPYFFTAMNLVFFCV